MMKRTITGAVITAAVYLVLYFSHIPQVMLCATAMLCTCAVYEIYRAAGVIENEILFIVSFTTALSIVFFEISAYNSVLKVVFALSVITFAFLMLLGRGCRIGHPVIAFYIASLVVMMIRSAPELREMTGGLYLLGAAVTLCFITDIAAYLAGRAFGRHKIAPVISPNKTVEGAFAGILAAVVCGELLGCLMESLGILEVDYAMLAVYSALASVAGQFGDFAMSAVKRVCGVKDFGNLLPGHGGVLDRFDSHIFAVSFTMIFCDITGGFIL